MNASNSDRGTSSDKAGLARPPIIGYMDYAPPHSRRLSLNRAGIIMIAARVATIFPSATRFSGGLPRAVAHCGRPKYLSDFIQL